MTMDKPNLLRRAAHKVLSHGLSKGSYESNGKVCAMGATRMAGDRCGVLEFGHFAPSNPEGWTMIVKWNDRRDTTAEDVASLLYSEAEVVE
jgi:hypothetical protein